MMKKMASIICALFLLLTVVSIPAAFAMGIDYTGTWACLYVDMGDGILLTEYGGQVLEEAMQVEFKADGTYVLNSFGVLEEGAWQPTGAGIAVFSDDIVMAFTYTDDQLVNTEDGVTMYFGRVADTPTQGGFNNLFNLSQSTPEPAFSYDGTWTATAYSVGGVAYDIAMFFPDGVSMTLAPDGTGVFQLTPDYGENITWASTDGNLEVNGSFYLYDPVWDAATNTLSLCYAADTVRIVFEKEEAAVIPAGSVLPQVYTCDFFSVAFPETWVQNEYSTYSWGSYFAAEYDLKDEYGWNVSSVLVSVSVEEVAGYRDEINTLLEYASAAGKDTLDELSIGGLTFLGTEYEEYGPYAKYAARVPEASVTILISISDPTKIQDVLPDILQSVAFSYPIPETPNVDPPLPEDGVAYVPSPTSVTVGSFDLQAKWLTAGTSIIPRDEYKTSIAAIDQTVYVLASKKLYAFNYDGTTFAAAGDPVDLGDEYSLLSATTGGTLYISDGFYQALAYQDGAATEFTADGYLSMSPDGGWGLTYWSSSTVQKVTFTADGVATKDWILKDLSDDTARQGRFQYVDQIAITSDHIFVAGTDAGTDYVTRIAMYDLEGNELAVFGGTDWSDPSYMSSVAGIVQTNNGILVQDASNRNYLLFAFDGSFLGSVKCDTLLGTDYPWPIELTASENGVLALVQQERKDQSAIELLIFEITGF